MGTRIPPPELWHHDPAALRAFLRDSGLTGVQAAALIGVDGRTVRRWLADDRDMPYSAWYTLVMRAREVMAGCYHGAAFILRGRL